MERAVSPQQLVYYRDNWYLDAWCHLRNAIRTFALDAMVSVQPTTDAAIDVDQQELARMLQGSYGIFAGPPKDWATLRFVPARAHWIAQEQWHPMQEGHFEVDGSYVLRVPYSDERELIRDILRHGPDVEVSGPVALRDQFQQLLATMQNRYKWPQRKARE